MSCMFSALQLDILDYVVLMEHIVSFVGGYYFELRCKFTENGCHENFRGNGPVQGTMESGTTSTLRRMYISIRRAPF